MYIWSSEKGKGHPARKDKNYVRIDDDNGVLVMDDKRNGCSVVTIAFEGPNTCDNVADWEKFVKKASPDWYDDVRSTVRMWVDEKLEDHREFKKYWDREVVPENKKLMDDLRDLGVFDDED